MVDHTFLFTGAVRKISQLIDEGSPGKALLLRFDARQPGPFPARCQRALGPGAARSFHHGSPDQGHSGGDCGHRPEASERPRRRGLHDLYFPDKIIAHINVNWLSPVKVRTTLIGGEKKMLVWNDLEADEKVRVYDKGVKITASEGVYELLVNYRSGDMWAPAGGAGRGPASGIGLFRGLHFKRAEPVQRRHARAAGREDAGSRRANRCRRGDRWSIYETPSTASQRRKAGQERPALEVHQSVWLRDRGRNKDRRIRRNPEERQGRQALQDLQPHLYLRRRHHRRQRLHRPRSDVHQRQLSPRHDCGGKPANRSRLEGRADGRQEGRVDRLRRHDSVQRHASGKTRSWAPAAWSPRMFRPTRSWPEIRPRFCVISIEAAGEQMQIPDAERFLFSTWLLLTGARAGTHRSISPGPANRRLRWRADGGGI